MSAAIPIMTVSVRREEDLLPARQRTRQISQFLGFSEGDSTRITTALSEVVRNAVEYGGGGSAAFAVHRTEGDREEMVITVADHGPGIPDVRAVLSKEFRSRTGMGVGLRGSRALMDRFTIRSSAAQGTVVVMAKQRPWTADRFGTAELARLTAELASRTETTPLGELRLQNQALLASLEESAQRQAEIERLSCVAEAARERAEAAQLVAERSLVVRERFMALTTHELRTPMSAIMGYLELLDMEVGPVLTEKQKGYFARAQRACAHLVGVINDFLVMAQGDAGRLTVTRLPGAARHVVGEAASLLAPQAAARGIDIQLAESMNGLQYLGDVARVRQVLVNLLGNAVSFTPVGGIVEVTAMRVDVAPQETGLTGGPWCAILVADSGPGIPEDKLPHVFEPFVQITGDGQQSRKGSGLGLTVSRQLAQLMGGELTAASNGTGAVFTLWLADASQDTPCPVTEPAPALDAAIP